MARVTEYMPVTLMRLLTAVLLGCRVGCNGKLDPGDPESEATADASDSSLPPDAIAATDSASVRANDASDGAPVESGAETSSSPSDAVSDASEGVDHCLDSSANPSGDAFAGVWSIVSAFGETYIFVINGGLISATAMNNSCTGSYTVLRPDTVNGVSEYITLTCMPLNDAGESGFTLTPLLFVYGTTIDLEFNSGLTYSWSGTRVCP